MKHEIPKIRTAVAVGGLVVAMALPLIFSCVKNVEPLSGVTATADISKLTVADFSDGSAQSALDTFVSENIPGRDTLIRTRNQGINSLFGKSTNANMIICKEDYIFEKSFLHRYEKIAEPCTDEFIRAKLDGLAYIKNRLAENGKDLYIFITPTKARYCEEYLDEDYLTRGYYRSETGDYEKLKTALKDYDLNVFDGIEYIDGLIADGDEVTSYPLFQPTGTHWTWPTGLKTALAFKDYMQGIGGYEFPESHQIIAPAESPVYPDADIYDSMNILKKAEGDYYTSDIIIDKDVDDELKPNVMMRGCSFMGQSLITLITSGHFNHDIYMQNTSRMCDRVSSQQTFTDYDEIDLKHDIDSSDIVIIEVNEAMIDNLGLGMIEYLNEHPEILE